MDKENNAVGGSIFNPTTEKPKKDLEKKENELVQTSAAGKYETKTTYHEDGSGTLSFGPR